MKYLDPLVGSESTEGAEVVEEAAAVVVVHQTLRLKHKPLKQQNLSQSFRKKSMGVKWKNRAQENRLKKM